MHIYIYETSFRSLISLVSFFIFQFFLSLSWSISATKIVLAVKIQFFPYRIQFFVRARAQLVLVQVAYDQDMGTRAWIDEG